MMNGRVISPPKLVKQVLENAARNATDSQEVCGVRADSAKRHGRYDGAGQSRLTYYQKEGPGGGAKLWTEPGIRRWLVFPDGVITALDADGVEFLDEFCTVKQHKPWPELVRGNNPLMVIKKGGYEGSQGVYGTLPQQAPAPTPPTTEPTRPWRFRDFKMD